MNRLIDRMLLRAQGPLSTVEPLAPSRFSSSFSRPAPEPESFTSQVATSADSGDLSHRSSPAASPSRAAFAPSSPPGQRHDRPAPSLRDPAPPHTIETSAPLRSPEPAGNTHLRSSHELPPDATPRTHGPDQHALAPAPEPHQHPAPEIRRGEAAVAPPSIPLAINSDRSQASGHPASPISRPEPIPSTPPEINISIGHIEVRSPQRPQIVRKPAPKATVQLDDYLRRGRGSERR